MIALSSEVLPQLVAGQFCPSVSEISLEFLLTSDMLGEGTEIITIPIMTSDDA